MSKNNQPKVQSNPQEVLQRCKVCTKKIHAGEDHFKVFHESTNYLVCCASCATKFEANPRAYLIV